MMGSVCCVIIQFIIKHDHQKQFLFVFLQSDAAVKLLLQLNNKNSILNSIVYIEDEIMYKKSTAVLRILKRIGGVWSFFYIFKIIPKKGRDYLYDLIANNRYKWFGKSKYCNVEIVPNKNRSI